MAKSLVRVQQKPWLWPLCMFFLLIVTAFAFSRGYGFQFIDWDDNVYIVNNPLITKISLSNFYAFFESERFTSLTLLSFTIDYHFFGLKPGGFHLVNLFIHLINVMLVYLLARKLNLVPLGALVVAVLFALHPTRVETVSWVMQRKDLLYTMFFLSGILIYIRYIQKGSRNLLLILCVFFFGYLSLLSKIQAYVFPLVLILIDIYLKRKFDFRNIFEKAFLILIFLPLKYDVNQWLLLILTFSILFLQYFYNFSKVFPFIQKRTVVNSGFLNLKQLFIWLLPSITIIFLINLVFQLQNISSNDLPMFYYPFLWFCLLGIFTEWLILRKHIIFSKKRLLIIFIPLIIVLVLGLILLITKSKLGIDEGLPTQESSMLQRLIMAAYSLSYYIVRCFFPFKLNAVEIYPLLIGGKFPVIYYLSFLLPIAILTLLIIFRRKLKDHRAIIIFCLLFFLINIFLVLHIVPIKGRVVVANRYTYLAYLGFFLLIGYFISRYSKTIKLKFFLTILTILAILLGVYDYNISGAWQNSKTFWNDAIAKNPENYYAWFGLGNVYISEGNSVEALKVFNRSASINPMFENVFNNRGVLKLDQSDYKGAVKDISEAIRLQKLSGVNFDGKNAIHDNSSYYFNRGNAYLPLKNFSSALTDYDTAISKHTTNASYYANRSLVKILLNDQNGAKTDIETSLKIDPNNIIAIANRGIISLNLKDSTAANTDFAYVFSTNPGLVDFYKQIGLDLSVR